MKNPRVGRRAIVRAAVAVPPIALLPSGALANASSFDFDRGNAAAEVVLPVAVPLVLASLSPGDATLVLRIAALTTNTWFDAIAPYHPTAIGVSSRLGRRPAAERDTNRQRNIALIYSGYRILDWLMPQARSSWRDMLRSVGLDPDDASQDIRTPIGIGNRAAAGVIQDRAHDGMNQLGDEGGVRYNLEPYANYVGYKPVNTAYDLLDPSRWQPDIVTGGNGVFRVQQFVTPQFGVTRPYSYRHPGTFQIAPPAKSNPVVNPDGYRRQVDQVIAASAGLTDDQKLVAEHFNDKIRGLASTVLFLSQVRRYTLDEFIFHEFAVNLAGFDAAIATWHFKRIFDAVRPFSAIEHVYGNRLIRAWGGPGQGTVSDIKGSRWRSYLRTSDHPEYPSGSAAICSAHAQSSRRFTGTDQLGQSIVVPQGSSVIEPGVTPRADTTLGPWETWTEWEQECGRSRLWGGVHFQDAIDAGHILGRQIGDRAHEFIARHIQGRHS